MAYSNYGAYVWKNGKNITDECCDTGFNYTLNSWYSNKIIKDKSGKATSVYSHAVIKLTDQILLEFYKTSTLNIYTGDRKQSVDLQKDVWERLRGTFGDITIVSYSLNKDNYIYFYEITYKNDKYCVIIGSSFGHGYDSKNISKFIRKHLRYVPDNDSSYYYIKTVSENQIDYYCRKDDKQDQRDAVWYWGIRPFLKDLFTFRWHNLAFDLKEIYEKFTDLRYLR